MNLYSYSRKRLFAQDYGRQAYLSTLVKRTLKSVARSSGGRIHTNKYLNLIDRLACAYPTTKGIQLLTDIKDEVAKYAKSHPVTVVRMNFMVALIAKYRCAQQSVDGALFTQHEGAFESAGDLGWLLEVTHKYNVTKGHCGHWHSIYESWHVQGNAETHEHSERICPTCAQQLIAADTHVRRATDHVLYMREFAVEIHSYGQNRYAGDRRNPEFSYDERRQIWHDRQWTPYSGLIDGYHSSRGKGFKVIRSPWYDSHRRAFGCELEVQATSVKAEVGAGRVHEVLNPSMNVGEYCYFERDGSIGEGFELITQPAGLDLLREKFALFLQNDELKRGLRSHEGGRCGFHVHVGREYVTQSQIYRMQSFLNDVRNESLIRAIARRYDSGYCRFKPQMAKFTMKDKNTGERYEALNVQNRDTIEFRIFRGSLRYESIIAALEFVNALMTFCTPGVTSFTDFTTLGFKKFIQTAEMKPDTKYLRGYLSLDQETDNEIRRAA